MNEKDRESSNSKKTYEQIIATSKSWYFDPFALADATDNKPIKYIMTYLFRRYGFFTAYSIDLDILTNFLERVEEGYTYRNNPFHNNVHAADTIQTVHYMLTSTGLKRWFTKLELFGLILSACMHDFDHMGTMNSFEVLTHSNIALTYNDRSVQENHHLRKTFFLLREEKCNILSNLTIEDYREVRTNIIDAILATDMAFHFQHYKDLKANLAMYVENKDKSKIVGYLLHTCDISYPCKHWDQYSRWSKSMTEECFAQGDRERELNLPISPLCDRNATLIPESQLTFVEFILEPSMTLLSKMIEHILQTMGRTSSAEHKKLKKPWLVCLAQNKARLREQTPAGDAFVDRNRSSR